MRAGYGAATPCHIWTLSRLALCTYVDVLASACALLAHAALVVTEVFPWDGVHPPSNGMFTLPKKTQNSDEPILKFTANACAPMRCALANAC
jgi:hypothetical protein